MAAGDSRIPYLLQQKRTASLRDCRTAKEKQIFRTKPANMDSTRQTALLKVFLVEDSLAIRARLAETIRAIEGTSLVGEAGSVAEAIAGIRSTHPGALILDLQLEDGSGLEVLRAVHPDSSALHVAVLTNYATDQHRRACMNAGAEFFLDKSSDFPRIRKIVEGWTACPAGCAARH